MVQLYQLTHYWCDFYSTWHFNYRLCGVLYGEGEEGHGHSHGGHSHKKKKQKGEEVSKEEKEKRKNINLRAAMIHVIGDLLQTVGVVVAGYIIWFNVHNSFLGAHKATKTTIMQIVTAVGL